jgi:hypothetical protein
MTMNVGADATPNSSRASFPDYRFNLVRRHRTRFLEILNSQERSARSPDDLKVSAGDVAPNSYPAAIGIWPPFEPLTVRAAS